MVYNQANENAKNKTVKGAIDLHADDFLNAVEKDVRDFLAGRGDADAAAQAAKVKKGLGDAIDAYRDSVGKVGQGT